MAAGNQSAWGPSGESGSTEQPSFLAGLEDLIARLYESSEAFEVGLSLPDFTCILNEIVGKYCGTPGKKDRRELLASLKLEELALARACAAGNEHAWELLLGKYRGPLYEMACSIAHDDVLAKEMADSLYADLYGISAKGEQGPSKLNFYNGIGSLIGWLRTVMVQGFVDRQRSGQRLTSLDEEDEEGERRIPEVAQQAVQAPLAPDPRLNEVVDAVLAAMDPEDRFLIAAYYLDRQTLTELAGLLNVHESTISRRLEKITQKLRKTIRVGLLKNGMSPAEVEDALLTDVRELELDVRARLKENAQKPDPRSFFKQRASTNRPQSKT